METEAPVDIARSEMCSDNELLPEIKTQCDNNVQKRQHSATISSAAEVEDVTISKAKTAKLQEVNEVVVDKINGFTRAALPEKILNQPKKRTLMGHDRVPLILRRPRKAAETTPVSTEAAEEKPTVNGSTQPSIRTQTTMSVTAGVVNILEEFGGPKPVEAPSLLVNHTPPSLLRPPKRDEANSIQLASTEKESASSLVKPAISQNVQSYTRKPNSVYLRRILVKDLAKFHDYSPHVLPVFRCVYCGVLFIHFNTARLHTLHNHKKEVGEGISCKICTYKAISWDKLLDHVISNHFVEYKSIKDRKIFPSARNFMESGDAVKSQNDEIWKSTSCDFSSIDKIAVTKHECKHRLECELVCHKCSLFFTDSDRTSFDQHMTSCATSGALPNLQCDTCGFSTFNHNLLENHRNSEPDHLHACPGCKVMFKDLQALVMKHIPLCSSLNCKNISSGKSESDGNKDVDLDDEWISKTKEAITRKNCKNPTGCDTPIIKPRLERKLNSLMGERLNLSFHALAEIIVQDGNHCRSCHQKITNDSDLLTHFIIHFSPCCRVCSVKEGQVCTLHGQWYYLNSVYFDKFSQHSFAKAKNTLKCKNCDVTIQNEQVVGYTSSICICPECSYFGNDQVAFFHMLQHHLWKMCKLCNFLTSSSDSFRAHVKDFLPKPAGANCPTCNSRVNQEFHQKHCMAALVQRLEAQDKTSSQKDQLLGICKPLMSLVCNICLEKFYSDKELALHTQHHPIYQCHLCFVFTDFVQEHYTIEHPDFSAKLTNPKFLLEVTAQLKTPFYEVMAKCGNVGVDVFKVLQTPKSRCLVCKRPFVVSVRINDVIQHFSLHFSPCCTKCTELGDGKRCELHSKPVFLHQTNYLDRLSQHDFIYTSHCKYSCKNCNFTLTRQSGSVIFRRFLQCSQCNFFTRVANSAKLVSHMMHHVALTICNFASCVDNIQSVAEYNRHLKTHIKRFLCSGCKLAISGTMKDVREHESTCKYVLIDLYSCAPKDKDTMEMMQSMLIQKEQCNRCVAHHEYDADSHTMFPFDRVCPICEKTFDSLHFDGHFQAEHQDFIIFTKKRLQIDGHPETNFAIVKSMWKKWLDDLAKPPTRVPSDDGHDSEPSVPTDFSACGSTEEGGEEEVQINCIKFKVKAAEYDRILELSFQEESSELKY